MATHQTEEIGREARLTALYEYGILDTPAEPGFDDIVFIASHVCATPIALGSLVDRDRQWFKARIGFEAFETPIGQAVCAYALAQPTLLVIPDLTQDPRTKDNPLVTASPSIRFYAGAPLITPAGVAIGTLCVIDHIPRPQGLTEAHAKVLEGLARQVVTQMELRRTNLDLRARDTHFRTAQGAGRVGTFEIDGKTNTATVSAQLCRLFGLAPAPSYPAESLEALIIPEDASVGSNAASRADGSAAPEVEYRIRRADDARLRWLARRAQFARDPSGRVTKMFGTVHDVTDGRRLQNFQAALLELGDRLRVARTTTEVVGVAGEILGRALEVSRAGYARIDTKLGKLEVEQDWTSPGAVSLAGRHALADFRATADYVGGGATIAVADVNTVGELCDDLESYRKIGTRAQIKVPLIDQDALVGLLYVHHMEERVWDQDEVDFAHGVADRTHAALGKVRAEADQQVLNRELSHRLKNTFAMIQAIATQTLRSVPGREPVEAFEKRLFALSAAHDVLVQQNWSAARITVVVDAVLGVFGEPLRFRVSGPDLNIGPRATLSLSLLLHELTTNAMKYGALSAEDGHVALAWRIEGEGKAAKLVLQWKEVGGPPVREPAVKGFGSRLIRMGLVGTGGVALRYPEAGFEAEMRASLDHLQQA